MSSAQREARAAWQHLAGEGARYAAASALALAVDFGTYWSLIHLAGVHYLLAAPAGFALGLATVYALCVSWVFARRRLADRRAEFLLFAAIGLGGMALNQAAVYIGVEHLALTYEHAKLVSAGLVFSFNFALRKVLLFTKA
jgi:putative flippase GtrA